MHGLLISFTLGLAFNITYGNPLTSPKSGESRRGPSRPEIFDSNGFTLHQSADRPLLDSQVFDLQGSRPTSV
eukprot:1191072-Prorocentrum_minimum.AAC.3